MFKSKAPNFITIFYNKFLHFAQVTHNLCR